MITWTGRPGDTVRPRRKSPYAHPSRSDGLGSGEGEQGWIYPAHLVLPIRYPPGRRRLRSESPGRAASLPIGDSGEWPYVIAAVLAWARYLVYLAWARSSPLDPAGALGASWLTKHP